ncbi:MAG TPA: family 2A encapsulin nanocompartment cargo protein cysteine desulfurase [Kofleriaceae bacterium]|nr:family 2A encapsulin nanocompartment cargo protein cysteine desulfurase [Kofleriaceae bacterium]
MTDEASGYLPPHELRTIGGTLVDRDDARLLGPSIATTSSPGLASAAAAPAAAGAPAWSADDPGTLAIAIARVIGEPLGATSVVPMPAPERAASEVGLPAAISPGISPELAAAPAPPPAPTPAATAPSVPPALHELGGEVRVPFALVDVADSFVPPGAGTGAWQSPPAAPALDVPMFGFERLPLLVDAEPSVQALAPPEIERVSLISTNEPAPREGGGSAFDPHIVRRDFPILEERVHSGKRLVWLDNAATTQKPRAVIDRLTYFYEHENSNVHRAAHALAARATDAYESARETTRKFLNATSASEIVFVRGTTEGINLIAKAWGPQHVARGDEIVLTHLEHHANIVPWQQLCAATGARLRVAPVDDRGDVILEAYEKLLCSRTKLVAFTQVSNALGTVTPAREMIASAHRWGATVVLDGAQAVSHMPVDVQALDCDFYVFSGHKVFAPTGIGAVFGKRALLDAMPPWQGGGNMIADVTFERTIYQQPPWRFEAGTGNIADAAGLGAALDYVLRIGMPTIDRYEHELLAYSLGQLATVPGLHMIGAPREQAGVLSFVLDGQRTEDVGAALDRDGIAVRSGHHCAQPILRRFGQESSVRASLAFYNTREDIDALVTALRRLQAASA